MTKSRYQRDVDREYAKLTTKQLANQIKRMSTKIDDEHLRAESKLTRALQELKRRYNV